MNTMTHPEGDILTKMHSSVATLIRGIPNADDLVDQLETDTTFVVLAIRFDDGVCTILKVVLTGETNLPLDVVESGTRFA